MRQLIQTPQLIGLVQLRVGDETVAVPVQAMPLGQDESARASGGFFMDASGQCGILIDSSLSEREAQRHIDKAILDAASQLSKRFLN